MTVGETTDIHDIVYVLCMDLGLEVHKSLNNMYM